MTDDTKQPIATDAATLDDTALLERALQRALQPPALPAGFRTQLLARVQGEQLADLESRRQQLALDYEGQRQQLHADYLRLRRNQLALIVASAFAAGVCVSLLLPWFYSLVDSVAYVSLPLVTLVVVLALGAGAWLERFGKTDLPGLSDR